MKIVEVLVYVLNAKVKDSFLGNVPMKVLRRQECKLRTWQPDSQRGTMLLHLFSPSIYFEFNEHALTV